MFTLTAHTSEIDDADRAVTEILDQLDLKKNMRKHAVGLIHCYSEFVESGVIRALSERLPFDIVGTTTLASAIGGSIDMTQLTLTVLTSDTVEFAVAMSTSLTGAQELPLKRAYKHACAALSEKPAMMIGYMALMQAVGGDRILALLDGITGGLPVFGTVTVDHTPDYTTAQVLMNGEAANDAFAFVLLGGDVHPTYCLTSVPQENIRRQQAIITASAGNVLQEVNDIPIVQYMQSLGLAPNGEIEGINAIPFLIDYGDGAPPVARAIFALTPDGHAVCGGDMPVGSTLLVGSIDYDDVVATTAAMMRTVRAHGGAALLYSCIIRSIALGVESLAEMETVQAELGEETPFQFCVSGGELCPVLDAEGRLINRFHNDTIVACIFETDGR